MSRQSYVHNIAKHATLITYYFMCKLKKSTVQQDSHLPIFSSKQLKVYVLGGRHTGTATNKHPTGLDQFVEVKVIHSGCVQYGRPEVRDNHKGAAAVQYFQSHTKHNT